MSEYLSYDDIEDMGQEPEVYDVDQGGWEHEDRGFDVNVAHTLKEIVRARRKDFFDPAVVRNEVAPDAMQYALGLARWSGFKRELALPKAQIETDIEARASRMRIASRRIAAYATGEILLANFTHKLDHDSERESALQTRFITLPNVSRALMLFALDSAAEFNFSPGRAFTDRLANLRERFDIPQP